MSTACKLVLLVALATRYCYCRNDGFIIRHYSGLCLALNNNTNYLYLSRSCKERFQWTASNTLMHMKTSFCVVPESDKDDSKLIGRNDCHNTFAVFTLSVNHSLQHVKTRKCLHPYWGCPVPSQGEDIVLHSACDQERLKFELIEGNFDCEPLYPYCATKTTPVSKSSSCLTNAIIKGLDWHWVYIIIATAATMVVGQFLFIICLYRKMMKLRNDNNHIHFGMAGKRKESLPGNESEDVQMISITTTEQQPVLNLNEFSDSSSSSIDKIGTPPSDEGSQAKEERSYINIDYNQNKNSGLRIFGRKKSKDRGSKRLSKLSIDASKMRQVFKIRKSYTLNDLEMLKRISIERHQYEEPTSPFSTCSAPDGKRAKHEGNKSEYVEPDGKCPRTRSASVPAKFTSKQDSSTSKQHTYLKPVISERDRKKCTEGSYISYVNIKPSSPVRTEKNLYDVPQMTLIEENAEECPLQVEAHTYVKILES